MSDPAPTKCSGPGCESTEIVYRNYQDRPFCCTCAACSDDDPLLRPSEPIVPATGPAPFLKGLFSLYELPDGGIAVFWRADGESEDRHMELPAAAMAAAKNYASGGGMLGALRALAGRN